MAKLQNRAKDRANDVRPYIERAFKDERVREDVKSAVLTAREIYEQLMGGRQLTAAVFAQSCKGYAQLIFCFFVVHLFLFV